MASESADFRALGGSLPGTSGALVSLPLDFDIGLSAGEYTLRIRVSDAHGGAADTLRRNIALTGASSTVLPTAPKIFWTAATTGFDSGADATRTEAATVFDATSGESVTVAVRVEDPRTPSKTTGFTYQWELNGSAFTPQSPGTGTAAQVSRTLTKAGLNTIALVVVNDDGEASAEALRKFYLNTIPNRKYDHDICPGSKLAAGQLSDCGNGNRQRGRNGKYQSGAALLCLFSGLRVGNHGSVEYDTCLSLP